MTFRVRPPSLPLISAIPAASTKLLRPTAAVTSGFAAHNAYARPMFEHLIEGLIKTGAPREKHHEGVTIFRDQVRAALGSEFAWVVQPAAQVFEPDAYVPANSPVARLDVLPVAHAGADHKVYVLTNAQGHKLMAEMTPSTTKLSTMPFGRDVEASAALRSSTSLAPYLEVLGFTTADISRMARAGGGDLVSSQGGRMILQGENFYVGGNDLDSYVVRNTPAITVLPKKSPAISVSEFYAGGYRTADGYPLESGKQAELTRLLRG